MIFKRRSPLSKWAVGLDPKFTRAWLWLGEIYKSRRQHDLALQAYRKALEADSTQPVSYKALASTLIGMRRYDDAVPVSCRTWSIAPDDVDGPTGLGAVLFALKR